MSQALSPQFFDDRSRRDSPPRKRLRGADLVTRAATAELLRRQIRHNEFEDPATVVERVYDRCPGTLAYLQRAATSPANTTTATWAAELVSNSIADFLSGPQNTSASAFAALADKAMSITLPPGTASIAIPSRASPQALVGAWVGESSAKPVTAVPLTTVSLAPFKLSAISVFSEELLQHSTPSIEAVVTEVLRHDLSALLDSALLDATAASAIRPAGLFAGVTPIVASVLTPTTEAMMIDLKALAVAVSTGNPDARPVFFASVTQVPRMTAAGYEVIATNYLAANSVACVDAGAIAMTMTPPEFLLSRDAAVHMEDTSPLGVGTGTQGSGVLAVPLRSTFQTDTVAIRSTLRAGWMRRRSGCCAIMASVTW